MAVTRSRSRSAARAASASSRPQAPPPKARSKRGAPRANESAPNKQARVTHHAQRALAVAQPPNAAAPPHTEFYLFKSESESRLQNGHQMKFSIDDLRAERDGITHWDGVRNAEACNCMKRMNKGDMAFFYHSNTNKSRPSVVGVVRVVSDPYPDHTAFDKSDVHYDARSKREKPRWFMVDVQFVRKFHNAVTLHCIKNDPRLADMQLVKRSRISVQSVTPHEWQVVHHLADQQPNYE
ncbi:Thymocyte nuclear protein 1 [Gracilariopsis chorda]|uniref:Thymocyte nuclear protein 1 n=1 Tax=Gracilariopsis chorda TaxID=448386 RepID=A0A2V3IGS3_9FLOR|nr:Thymocyte nuclear protein 1 [Gracilariopsis chorda]|eukprot:PXF41238.1 Thymocyte nuclear protein 1 [Gracilariopsis chorda]